MSRVLVGGIGYRNLRDMSLGPLLIDRLQQTSWRDGVDVEDLSYGPIGIMHSLDERPAYDRMVLVAGSKRGRNPGDLSVYQWSHQLPDEDEIHQRVTEAATGVIDLENFLIVATYFRKLPKDVVIIEVEAADDTFGESMTPLIETRIPDVIDEVRAAVGER